MDASAISWVLAGNDLAPLPGPVRDRLTVIDVPPMSEAHLAAVVASIYAEANAAKNGFFDPQIEPDVLGRLLTLSPRGIRKAVDDAMVRAASQGRRRVRAEDVDTRRRGSARGIGFHISVSA